MLCTANLCLPRYSNLPQLLALGRAWDVDQLGTLSRRDFVRAMRELGSPATQRELAALFDRIDHRGLGCVDLEVRAELLTVPLPPSCPIFDSACPVLSKSACSSFPGAQSGAGEVLCSQHSGDEHRPRPATCSAHSGLSNVACLAGIGRFRLKYVQVVSLKVDSHVRGCYAQDGHLDSNISHSASQPALHTCC